MDLPVDFYQTETQMDTDEKLYFSFSDVEENIVGIVRPNLEERPMETEVEITILTPEEQKKEIQRQRKARKRANQRDKKRKARDQAQAPEENPRPLKRSRDENGLPIDTKFNQEPEDIQRDDLSTDSIGITPSSPDFNSCGDWMMPSQLFQAPRWDTQVSNNGWSSGQNSSQDFANLDLENNPEPSVFQLPPANDVPQKPWRSQTLQKSMLQVPAAKPWQNAIAQEPTYYSLAEYKDLEDYAEGLHPTRNHEKFPDLVFFGRLPKGQEASYTLKNHRIEFDADENEWIGHMFYCERQNRNEEYSCLKNMAFMAGAIKARKIFHMVTPLEQYKNNHHKKSMTRIELYWLMSNGYTPVQDADGLLWFLPPAHDLEPLMIHEDSVTAEMKRDSWSRINSLFKIPKLAQRPILALRKPHVEALAMKGASTQITMPVDIKKPWNK